MEKEDIVSGQIGSVGHYDVDFVGGKLVLNVVVAHGPVSSSSKIELGAAQLWDLLADKAKAAIPGQIDDMVFDLIRGALFGSK